MIKPKARIYYPEKIVANEKVKLSLEDSHHLSKVLRLNAEDHISIFNQKSGEWLAKLGVVSKHGVEVIPIKQFKKPEIKYYHLHLLYAPLKNTASGFLIEKATEIGVSSITQVITERTTNNAIEIQKLQLKVKQAANQCGRLDLPVINETLSLKNLITFTKINPAHPIIWLNEQQNGTSLYNYLSSHKLSHISIFIGPEGGFTNHEQNSLLDNPYFINCYLAGNILKAETAGLVSLALANYKSLVK